MENLLYTEAFDVVSYHEKLVSEICKITGMDRNEQSDIITAINCSIVPIAMGLKDLDDYLELTNKYLNMLSRSLDYELHSDKLIYLEGILATHYLAYLGGEVVGKLIDHGRFGYTSISRLKDSLIEKIGEKSVCLSLTLCKIQNKLNKEGLVINDFYDIFGREENYAFSPKDGILLVKHLTELQQIYIERLKNLYKV